MAIVNKKHTHSPMATLLTGISDVISPNAGSIVSLEAYSDIESPLAANNQSALVNSLTPIFKESCEAQGIQLGDTYSEEAILSAATMAMVTSSQNAYKGYANSFFNTKVDAGNATVIAPSSNAAFGYMDEANVSLEAFDASNLTNLRTAMVAFAFTAATQDEFCEAFFKPVTLTPDSTGLEVSLRRTVIMAEVRHPETGEVARYEQRNLLDAYTEPSLLINEATRIYPRVIIGNEKSEKHFVDKTVIAPTKKLGANGVEIDAAPLRVGPYINLLGAGANERTPGTPDQTDAIAAAVTVTALYYRIKTSSGESIISFDTKSFAHNGYQKSFEGHNRRIALDFHTNALFVNGETTDITGAPAEALAFLNADPYSNVTIQLRDSISGDGNLQRGEIRIASSYAEVASAREVEGPHDFTVITNETTLDALTSQFEAIELIGYDVKAYYANTNKRFIGTLIDVVEESVRYIIPLLPPISVQSPINGAPTQVDLSGPINAQRMTNSMNGVTKLIEVRDLLRDVVKNVDYGDNSTAVAQIEGFARTMVRPYLHEDVINLAHVVQSTSTAERPTNIQAALVNAIRYGVATMYTESRYQPFLDSLNGTTGGRPTVVIGTDPRTASYLLVNGDPRLIGVGMPSKVVVSYDVRMRNQIAATFVRPEVGEVDLASFGVFAYMPEVITQAKIPYNNAFADVTQVHNRNLHVCFLPVLGWWKVEGLEHAATKDAGFSVRLG